MHVALIKENQPDEGRVALTPHACHQLIAAGHCVSVQAGAGVESGYPDEAYRQAGATLSDEPERLWREAEIIVKVREPSLEEAAWLQTEQRLFCYLHLASKPRLAEALCRSGVIALGYETVTDAQGHLPLLAPMSAIGGRLAAQIGANLLMKHHKGRGVLLGGVAGAARGSAVVVGLGTAGTQAVEVLTALGAEVLAFDKRIARLEALHSAHPNLTALYAHPEAIADAVVDADLVICAAHVVGQRAPLLLQRAHVQAMRPGAVIVDLAVEQGGSVETTRATTYSDPTYLAHEIVHFAVPNIPCAVPRTASEALSGRITPYVLRLAERDWSTSPALSSGVNVEAGGIVHPAVCAALAEAGMAE